MGRMSDEWYRAGANNEALACLREKRFLSRLSIDDEAPTRTDTTDKKGAWVQCWLWVADPEEDK